MAFSSSIVFSLDIFRRKAPETRATGTGYTAAMMTARGTFIAGTSTGVELSATVQAAVSLWEAGLWLADVKGTALLTRRHLAVPCATRRCS